MKCEVAVSLSIAVASLTLLCPQAARARSMMNSPKTTAMAPMSASMSAAKREAMDMIPVVTSLESALDARKAKPGHKFEVKLRGTAHLKDGLKLPNGTTLIGRVATDRMHQHGTSRLALRFTEARLKNGKMIPIKATIVDVSQPPSGYDIDSGVVASSIWSDKTLQVDEINALSGVDLHSKIGGQNSGVFVSNRKDDMKLSTGTRLTLAIAAGKKHSAKGTA